MTMVPRADPCYRSNVFFVYLQVKTCYTGPELSINANSVPFEISLKAQPPLPVPANMFRTDQIKIIVHI